VALFDRLSIRRKLQLLTVLVLIALSIPSALQIRQAHALAQAAQGEVDGLSTARALVKLAQLTQHHRGLSAAVLGGKAEVQGAQAAKNAEVSKQFESLDGQFKGSPMTEAMNATWRDARKQWDSLSADVGAKALKAAASSTRHAQLIAVYFKLLDQLVDQSGLILDPEAHTYFLMTAALVRLPAATEAMGQARARGAGFLAEGQIDLEGKAMLAGLVQQANDQHVGMVTAFDKAFAGSNGVKQNLSDAVTRLGGLIDGSLNLTRQELIAKEQLVYPASDYIANYTKTIDAMFAVGERAMDLLGELLAERVHDLRSGTWIMVGLLCLMMATVGFISVSISRSITLPMQRATSLAQRIAERDLRGEIEIGRNDEIGQLTTTLLLMRDSLRGVISEVRGNAGQVAQSSEEVAVGNADLSQRTEQQASALEQTASSMEELTTTVRSNADQAMSASALARRACDVAQHGGQAVDQIVETMGGIEASSRKIEEIIAVIDSIAFQTNILALNAAVEAARAGEQGRGFAVVASEVRALAQRSAEAAKQIKQLIATSVGQVETGAKLVNSAGATMHEMVDAIHSVADMIASISQASKEQSGGLNQINEAVSHMDQLTQQNAALVEQTAAAGVSLQEQAKRLSALVNTFQVPEVLGARDGS